MNVMWFTDVHSFIHSFRYVFHQLFQTYFNPVPIRHVLSNTIILLAMRLMLFMEVFIYIYFVYNQILMSLITCSICKLTSSSHDIT